MGRTSVMLKSDNGPLIKSLVRRVRYMSHPTIAEGSLEYEPQASGMGERIPDDHPVLICIGRHSAPFRNSHHVGSDGRTTLERVAGKRSE